MKAAVEIAYRAEQAQTLAHELADKLLIEAKESNNLPAAAKKLKLSLEESGEFSRSFGSFIPRVGNSEELAEDSFKLAKETSVALKSTKSATGSWSHH